MHTALAQKFYISSVFNLLMNISSAFFISVIGFKNISSIYFLFFLKTCLSLLILFICSHMLSTLSITALGILIMKKKSGKCHLGSLAGNSPWGHKELDMTE